MSKVLFVKASPRGIRSHSVAVANQFIDSYMKRDLDAQVNIHDLFKMELPPMDGQTLGAKYSIMHGHQATNEEQLSWMKVEGIIEDFMDADKYVFAVPMWNFGIPYRLKHYLDVIIQPSHTFEYLPDKGYTGLVTGRPCYISFASGGEYSPGTQGEDLDYCRNYIQLALSFIGITDIRQTVVEPTMQKGPEEARRRQEAAVAAARRIAEQF